MEMREANQTHFTLTGWPFPVIALIHYYHHLLHCLQLQKLQAELRESHSYFNLTGEQLYLPTHACAVVYNSINETGKPWSELCFYGACNHPANHSSSTGQRVAKTGSNRPNGEEKQVQRLASVCNPVRQRVWQKLKELSPY